MTLTSEAELQHLSDFETRPLAPPHELLPARSELLPITDKNSTFSDTYFNRPFDQLSFNDKLRTVVDVIRQSTLPAYYSDPTSEQLTLIGDCHMASRVAIMYMGYLGLGQDYQYAMVNRRPFDPPEKTYSKHAIAITKDSQGNDWQVDAAPWMGYGYGTVSGPHEGLMIDDYSPISSEAQTILDEIKQLRLAARSKRPLPAEELDYYHDVARSGEQFDYLRGFVGEAYAALALRAINQTRQCQLADRALAFDPYRGANHEILHLASDPSYHLWARRRLQQYTEAQCQIWQAELSDLQRVDSEESLERQLKLAQLIANERKFAQPELVAKLNLDGQLRPATDFNPRFMRDMGLSVAIIKPSAYFIGASATIKEQLRKHNPCGDYTFDPTKPTECGNLTPLLFSHSLAKQFERAYTGPNTVVFTKDSSANLALTKQQLRSSIGRIIAGQNVIWSDGRPVNWHPFAMNYLHSTDNPQEAALHGLFGMPEFAPFNRWMYPNPKLV